MPMRLAVTFWMRFSKEAIESAYQRITMEARNQYTLGYNTRAEAFQQLS